MTQSVWKWILNSQESNIIEVPLSTQILSTETQGDDIVVYGLVNVNEEEKAKIDFRVYGTGHEFKMGSDYKFIGTIKMYSGSLMFHVFYKRVD
jgi:hypothetical protein